MCIAVAVVRLTVHARTHARRRMEVSKNPAPQPMRDAPSRSERSKMKCTDMHGVRACVAAEREKERWEVGMYKNIGGKKGEI